MKTLATLGAIGLACSLSCMPAYLDTVAPSDATFDVTCVPSCGKGGLDAGVLIEASFSGGTRQYALCCEHRAALMAQLQTIEDLWCDGLDVPDKTIGGLTVGVVISEVTGTRGATIDDGEGFVAFNCDAWLGQLIAKLKQTTCCQPGALTVPTAPSGADRPEPVL
ncbi:MAG: hypothetical protein JRI68_28095 [Deltaproteobacteria bacterium]|nr:hypothetical protein [Deltaproteobacteria bacterium]